MHNIIITGSVYAPSTPDRNSSFKELKDYKYNFIEELIFDLENRDWESLFGEDQILDWEEDALGADIEPAFFEFLASDIAEKFEKEAVEFKRSYFEVFDEAMWDYDITLSLTFEEEYNKFKGEQVFNV